VCRLSVGPGEHCVNACMLPDTGCDFFPEQYVCSEDSDLPVADYGTVKGDMVPTPGWGLVGCLAVSHHGRAYYWVTDSNSGVLLNRPADGPTACMPTLRL